MQFTQETITPERARAILDTCNVNNYRAIAESVVKRYALDMAHGRWRETGEAIKFDVSGALADGQHRLAACVASGQSFNTAVIRGVEVDAAEIMDFGRKRTLESILKRRGEHNSMRLSGAISLGWKLETDNLLANVTPSAVEALEWLRRNPNIGEAVRLTTPMVAALGVVPSSYAVFTYFAQRIDPEEEVLFRHALLNGAGLEKGHPILAFRNLTLTGQRFAPPVQITCLALLIKTWNACVQGRNVNVLVWRRQGVNREAFPRMVAKKAAA